MSTTWVAARFGLDPVRVNALRRAGELYAFRLPGGDWLYPAWQFDAKGVRPGVAAFFAAAREEGFGAADLDEILARRVGIVGGSSVIELLRGDRPEQAIPAIR